MIYWTDRSPQADRPADENSHYSSLAVVTGLLISLGILILFYLLRRIGLSQFDPALILGSFFIRKVDFFTDIFGITLFAAIGAGIGALYRQILKSDFGAKDGAIRGVRLSFFHWIGSGLYLGSLTAIHPLVPEKIPAPGFFGVSQGLTTVFAVLLSHLAFGVIFGMLNKMEARAYLERHREFEPRESRSDETKHHPTRAA